MPQLLQLSGPMLGAATGFHPYQAWRLVAEKLKKVHSLNLLINNFTSKFIDEVNLNDVLCDINTEWS
ncbi:hypothetical protein D3C81_1929010 [compost metagenome]